MGGPKLKLGICVLQLKELRDALKENTDAHPRTRLKANQLAPSVHCTRNETAPLQQQAVSTALLRPWHDVPTAEQFFGEVNAGCRIPTAWHPFRRDNQPAQPFSSWASNRKPAQANTS